MVRCGKGLIVFTAALIIQGYAEPIDFKRVFHTPHKKYDEFEILERSSFEPDDSSHPKCCTDRPQAIANAQVLVNLARNAHSKCPEPQHNAIRYPLVYAQPIACPPNPFHIPTNFHHPFYPTFSPFAYYPHSGPKTSQSSIWNYHQNVQTIFDPKDAYDVDLAIPCESEFVLKQLSPGDLGGEIDEVKVKSIRPIFPLNEGVLEISEVRKGPCGETAKEVIEINPGKKLIAAEISQKADDAVVVKVDVEVKEDQNVCHPKEVQEKDIIIAVADKEEEKRRPVPAEVQRKLLYTIENLVRHLVRDDDKTTLAPCEKLRIAEVLTQLLVNLKHGAEPETISEENLLFFFDFVKKMQEEYVIAGKPEALQTRIGTPGEPQLLKDVPVVFASPQIPRKRDLSREEVRAKILGEIKIPLLHRYLVQLNEERAKLSGAIPLSSDDVINSWVDAVLDEQKKASLKEVTKEASELIEEVNFDAKSGKKEEISETVVVVEDVEEEPRFYSDPNIFGLDPEKKLEEILKIKRKELTNFDVDLVTKYLEKNKVNTALFRPNVPVDFIVQEGEIEEVKEGTKFITKEEIKQEVEQVNGNDLLKLPKDKDSINRYLLKKILECEDPKDGSKFNPLPIKDFESAVKERDFVDWYRLKKILEHEEELGKLERNDDPIKSGRFDRIRLDEEKDFIRRYLLDKVLQKPGAEEGKISLLDQFLVADDLKAEEIALTEDVLQKEERYRNLLDELDLYGWKQYYDELNSKRIEAAKDAIVERKLEDERKYFAEDSIKRKIEEDELIDRKNDEVKISLVDQVLAADDLKKEEIALTDDILQKEETYRNLQGELDRYRLKQYYDLLNLKGAEVALIERKIEQDEKLIVEEIEGEKKLIERDELGQGLIKKQIEEDEFIDQSYLLGKYLEKLKKEKVIKDDLKKEEIALTDDVLQKEETYRNLQAELDRYRLKQYYDLLSLKGAEDALIGRKIEQDEKLIAEEIEGEKKLIERDELGQGLIKKQIEGDEFIDKSYLIEKYLQELKKEKIIDEEKISLFDQFLAADDLNKEEIVLTEDVLQKEETERNLQGELDRYRLKQYYDLLNLKGAEVAEDALIGRKIEEDKTLIAEAIEGEKKLIERDELGQGLIKKQIEEDALVDQSYLIEQYLQKLEKGKAIDEGKISLLDQFLAADNLKKEEIALTEDALQKEETYKNRYRLKQYYDLLSLNGAEDALIEQDEKLIAEAIDGEKKLIERDELGQGFIKKQIEEDELIETIKLQEERDLIQRYLLEKILEESKQEGKVDAFLTADNLKNEEIALTEDVVQKEETYRNLQAELDRYRLKQYYDLLNFQRAEVEADALTGRKIEQEEESIVEKIVDETKLIGRDEFTQDLIKKKIEEDELIEKEIEEDESIGKEKEIIRQIEQNKEVIEEIEEDEKIRWEIAEDELIRRKLDQELIAEDLIRKKIQDKKLIEKQIKEDDLFEQNLNQWEIRKVVEEKEQIDENARLIELEKEVKALYREKSNLDGLTWSDLGEINKVIENLDVIKLKLNDLEKLKGCRCEKDRSKLVEEKFETRTPTGYEILTPKSCRCYQCCQSWQKKIFPFDVDDLNARKNPADILDLLFGSGNCRAPFLVRSETIGGRSCSSCAPYVKEINDHQ